MTSPKNMFYGAPYALITYKPKVYFCMHWSDSYLSKNEHKKKVLNKEDGEIVQTHGVPVFFQRNTAEAPGNLDVIGTSQEKIQMWKSGVDFKEKPGLTAKQEKRVREKQNKKERNNGLIRNADQQAKRIEKYWENNKCQRCGKKCLKQEAVVCFCCLKFPEPDDGSTEALIRVHYKCGNTEDGSFIYPCHKCGEPLEISLEQIKKLRLPKCFFG